MDIEKIKKNMDFAIAFMLGANVALFIAIILISLIKFS
jgi:hypothetical protein